MFWLTELPFRNVPSPVIILRGEKSAILNTEENNHLFKIVTSLGAKNLMPLEIGT